MLEFIDTIFDNLFKGLAFILNFLIGFAPEYKVLVLAGLSLLLGYLYSKVDWRNSLAPGREWSVAVFAGVLFLFFELLLLSYKG